MLYFLTAAPYSTTFCRKTWHNRAAEAAHAVTFDFSSGFYNRFPVTGCRIRRFLCQIHHRRFFSRRGGFQAHLVLYFFVLYRPFIQLPASEYPLQKIAESRGAAVGGKAHIYLSDNISLPSRTSPQSTALNLQAAAPAAVIPAKNTLQFQR